MTRRKSVFINLDFPSHPTIQKDKEICVYCLSTCTLYIARYILDRGNQYRTGMRGCADAENYVYYVKYPANFDRNRYDIVNSP